MGYKYINTNEIPGELSRETGYLLMCNLLWLRNESRLSQKKKMFD